MILNSSDEGRGVDVKFEESSFDCFGSDELIILTELIVGIEDFGFDLSEILVQFLRLNAIAFYKATGFIPKIMRHLLFEAKLCSLAIDGDASIN